MIGRNVQGRAAVPRFVIPEYESSLEIVVVTGARLLLRKRKCYGMGILGNNRCRNTFLDEADDGYGRLRSRLGEKGEMGWPEILIPGLTQEQSLKKIKIAL